METLHDTPTDDPTAWQRPAHLARLLDVNERTLRKMATRGEVERLRHKGRVYYRAVPESDRPGSAGPEPSAQAGSGPDLDDDKLKYALVELNRDFQTTVAQLNADLTSARVEAERNAAALERAELIAEHERERAEEIEAELNAALAVAGSERLRAETIERYTAMPWWRRRERRRLRERLIKIEEARSA